MFPSYSSGTFKQPIIADSGRCIGVECKDGTKHYADRVIMATGAWTPSLVDLKGQCVSKVSAAAIEMECSLHAELLFCSAGSSPTSSSATKKPPATATSPSSTTPPSVSSSNPGSYPTPTPHPPTPPPAG